MKEQINYYFLFIFKEYESIFTSAYQFPIKHIELLIILSFFIVFLFLSKTRIAQNKFLFIFTFPGTILHEFLHFIIGYILLAKPVSFSLIPHRTENGWVLGSVSFVGLNSLNAIPTAIAPILSPILILLTFPSVYNFILNGQHPITYSFIYSFFIVSGINECIPSSTDFKLAISKPFGVLLYLLFFIFIFKYVNF